MLRRTSERQPPVDPSIDDAANVMPTSKTLVHSFLFRVTHGVESLACCWQLTNSRVSLGRSRVPHEVGAGGISCSKMRQQFSAQNERGCE